MDHTKRFMELLNNPDKKMKVIHVAGTNGKGSTCAYMNQILYECGYKVGMFTSPHLEQMTERIRIQNENVSEVTFVDAFEKVRKVIVDLEQEGKSHPTFFEFLFGMAMVAFVDAGVEYAILETGLGGRLDATNCIEKPIVTVLTSIGLDHQAYLGDTVASIAAEKAGIIKQGVPVIYEGNQLDVCRVIEERARTVQAPCRKIADSAYEITKITEKDIDFCLVDDYDKHTTWKIKNHGKFQVMNASLAITALKEVLKDNFDIWSHALYHTQWAGRMEEIQEGIYVDGAHNIPAIQAVVKDMQELDVVLFSAVSDKSYGEMIQILTNEIKTRAYVVTRIDDKRGISAETLAEIFKLYTQTPIYIEENIEDAWNIANALKEKDGKMLCLGSLYLIGMIKKLVIKE